MNLFSADTKLSVNRIFMGVSAGTKVERCKIEKRVFEGSQCRS